MSFDISQIESVDTVFVEILHPQTGKATGAVVEVASYDGDRAKAVQRKLANASLKKRNRKLTAEQMESNTLDIAVAVVVSWKGIEDGGKEIDCTPDNVRKLLAEHTWFAQQIDEAASDLAAFIKA